ncbi:M23 family metallopeptidase [Oceanicoccus sp. KOV_DT_Chl]|uniref:M23 family metallopeptidase n=1 Tax=Oceanicoccus sp. KOV_DT_Chl TaxID=1904639 RepID=UPI000C7AABF4|nr:M23 family metallopeptidase [Oceanicoccus sp. KOV_DT_Chl]
MRFVVLLLAALSVLPSLAVELTGDLQQGGMLVGQVAPGSQVSLDGTRIKVSAGGVFVLGFDRDAAATAELKVTEPSGEVAVKTLQIEARQYKIQRIEGIAKKIMSPSESDLLRIRREAAEVRQARAQVFERLDFANAFQWPLTGPISGVFGSQRVYNGVPSRPHYGVDVAAPVGTPVSTPAPGTVTLAHPDMFYSGGTVIIDHGHGVSSTLMHLSKVLVEVGQEVVPGDIVAEVGAGGRATGPHLDWRMNWFNARIDPQLLVSEMPVTENK